MACCVLQSVFCFEFGLLMFVLCASCFVCCVLLVFGVTLILLSVDGCVLRRDCWLLARVH